MFSKFLNIPLITVSFSGSTPPTLVFDNTKYHHGEHMWTTRCLPVSPRVDPGKGKKPGNPHPWVPGSLGERTPPLRPQRRTCWGFGWEHDGNMNKKSWEKRREMLWWDYHGDVKLTMMDFSTENNWYEWGNWYLTIQKLGYWECKHHPKGLFTNKTRDIEELTLELTYTLPLGLA